MQDKEARKQAVGRVDAAVIAAVRSGKYRASAIELYVKAYEPDALTALMDTGKRVLRPEFRVIDSRLQALRKAGRIKHHGPALGWRLTEAERKRGGGW